MNWKKIGLFILFLVAGTLVFAIPSVVFVTWLTPILFVAYLIALVFVLRAFSKLKLTVLLSLVFIYLLIMAIPFPTCYYGSYWNDIRQNCTCFGVEKHRVFISDLAYTQCVGIPTKRVCTRDTDAGEEEVPCRQDTVK